MYGASHSPSSKPTLYERFLRHRYPIEHLFVLGNVHIRSGPTRLFGLLPQDRQRHLWMVGQTGVGKSTLLANLLAQDLAQNRGLALLDPHGPLFKTALSLVPAHRTNDTLVFDPSDTANPIAFNVFRRGRAAYPNRTLLASSLVSVFRKQWSEFWGPRLEHVLRNAILAVAEHPEATLTLLYRFLTQDQLQQKLIARLCDPMVKQFWCEEWPRYSKALRAEALSPILNKLGAFVLHPTIRAIVGQVACRIDLQSMMEKKQILLANLSVGSIGEDTSRLLGGLLLSAIELAAMSRPAPVTPPFFVYLDEFQRFVSDSLPSLLSESRKFGLGLVLAHQYLGQLPEATQAAMLGNIGTILTFRVGTTDAQLLAPLFAPALNPHHLVSLAPFRMAVRQLARGERLVPFLANTLPPQPTPMDTATRVARIQDQSRARFATQLSVDNSTSLPLPTHKSTGTPLTWH